MEALKMEAVEDVSCWRWKLLKMEAANNRSWWRQKLILKVLNYSQEEIRFIPGRAPAYPKEKRWSQAETQETRTRRTHKYGILL